MAKMIDMAILGTTPAGLAAAYVLAARGCEVTVIDTPSSGSDCPLSDWTPSGTFNLRGLPKSLVRRCGARAFKSVSYHSVKLDVRADYRSRSIQGYFVVPDRLRAALAAETAGAGAKTRAFRDTPTIRLNEDKVVIGGSRGIRARLLLLTQGSANEAMTSLSLHGQSPGRSTLAAAGLDIPLGTSRPGTASSPGGPELHVVEMSRRTELGMFFTSGRTLHVRVISSAPDSKARASCLSSLTGNLHEAGLIPRRLALGRAAGAFWQPQGGVALEMGRHSAKRCLLAGSAGGFAAPVTGQTLYASVYSGLLAARCAWSALEGPDADVQKALTGFRTTWRNAFARYLCPPGTNLQMLLPLLFANQRVVPRFTRALLQGRKI